MKTLIITIAIILSAIPFSFGQKKGLEIGVNAYYQVKVKTSVGSFTLKLFNDTPKHRDNFVKLCKEGFYDQLIFHRVIKDFMIQCGDPKSIEAMSTVHYGEDDAGYKIESETQPHYFHKKGMLAAAREPDSDNPNRLSSGSHFYVVVGKPHNDSTINVANERLKKAGAVEVTPERAEVYKTLGGAPHLDGCYTIFGEITAGQKVVDKINSTKTHKGTDRPFDDVFIETCQVKIVEEK